MGTGFGFRIPGVLPEQAMTTFVDVSVLDLALSELRDHDASDPDSQALLNVRNDLHHDLLSLVPREELDDTTGANTSPATYEICRLTYIVYSNAVRLDLPPHSRWHTGLVHRLRKLLDLSSLSSWCEESLMFLTGFYFLGGIASYRSFVREFFQKHLRHNLLKRAGPPWSQVHESLLEFIWSDSACEMAQRFCGTH